MPCASVTEAVDDIMGLVYTAWEANVVTPLGFQSLIFDDNPGDRPTDTSGGDVVGWGNALIRHVTGGQAALSGDGTARSLWRREGVVTVEVYAPQARGRVELDQAVQAVLDAFEGIHTENGVWFRNVRVAEQGQSGIWYKANVLADFEYDQLK